MLNFESVVVVLASVYVFLAFQIIQIQSFKTRH